MGKHIEINFGEFKLVLTWITVPNSITIFYWVRRLLEHIVQLIAPHSRIIANRRNS